MMRSKIVLPSAAFTCTHAGRTANKASLGGASSRTFGTKFCDVFSKTSASPILTNLAGLESGRAGFDMGLKLPIKLGSNAESGASLETRMGTSNA